MGHKLGKINQQVFKPFIDSKGANAEGFFVTELDARSPISNIVAETSKCQATLNSIACCKGLETLQYSIIIHLALPQLELGHEWEIDSMLSCVPYIWNRVNTLRPGENDRLFADDMVKSTSLNE